MQFNSSKEQVDNAKTLEHDLVLKWSDVVPGMSEKNALYVRLVDDLNTTDLVRRRRSIIRSVILTVVVTIIAEITRRAISKLIQMYKKYRAQSRGIAYKSDQLVSINGVNYIPE